MNLRLSRLFFALLLVCCDGSVAGGFVADTLILTTAGYRPIQDLLVGDELIVPVSDDSATSAPIQQIACRTTNRIIQLHVGDDILEMEESQLVYMLGQKRWIPASKIGVGDRLLGVPFHELAAIAIVPLQKATVVYEISLASYHHYAVGQHNVVVHNFAGAAAMPVFAMTKSGLLGVSLTPFMLPIVLGAAGIGAVGYLVWNASHNNEESQLHKNNDDHQSPGTNGSGGPAAAGSAVAFLESLENNKQKTLEVFLKSCEYLTSTRGGLETISHVFRANCRHNFGPLLARLGANINDPSSGGQRKIAEVGAKILADIIQRLVQMGARLPVDVDGQFRSVVIEYEGELITVRGRIHDGIIKIGTAFIQQQHVRTVT